MSALLGTSFACVSAGALVSVKAATSTASASGSPETVTGTVSFPLSFSGFGSSPSVEISFASFADFALAAAASWPVASLAAASLAAFAFAAAFVAGFSWVCTSATLRLSVGLLERGRGVALATLGGRLLKAGLPLAAGVVLDADALALGCPLAMVGMVPSHGSAPH
eukprot:CAMPEP_0181415784 /NCGR_PEP_ID=MMETSP1110-20121109/10191_1 /TAXON_ID=174948 /ORGANISM="Symbiodinium sp., Strain CCMP421" /LENGTH=165 /DNA_ID=CAMNT_0023538689 /DNA_START=457 /DNA_END=951 /DNA_ORIENTATION=+